MRNRLVVLALTVATFLALWAQPAIAIWRPGHP